MTTSIIDLILTEEFPDGDVPTVVDLTEEVTEDMSVITADLSEMTFDDPAPTLAEEVPLEGMSVIRFVVDLFYPDGDAPDIVDLNQIFNAFPDYVDALESYLSLDAADRDPLDPEFSFLGGVALTGISGNNDEDLVGSLFEDALFGLGGDDTINGFNWADNLKGGRGNDVIYGGNGDDDISGGLGRDVLHGDAGDDDMNGGAGKDRMFGGTGDDVMNGKGGRDKLKGGDGDDEMSGGAGKDRLYGQNDDDTLDGGAGDDLMFGGSGNDTIMLGDGEERAYGGDGADTFVFTAGTTGIDEVYIDADDVFEAVGFEAGTTVNATQATGSDTINLLIDDEIVAIVHTDMTPQDVIDLFGF